MAVQPLVSIIIPTYNRANRLVNTLNSVRSQTYTNWECLVVDDGSTDNTVSLLQQLISEDKRFKFLKRKTQEPKGANTCRNIGLRVSKGKFINFLDSDDLLAPDKLEIQIKRLQTGGQHVSICKTKWYDAKLKKSLGIRSDTLISKNTLEDYITSKIVWPILAPVWNRSFLEEHNLWFDVRLQQSQEYDFHIRAISKIPEIDTLEKSLCLMVKHEDNMSNSSLNTYSKVNSNLLARYKAIQIGVLNIKTKEQIHFYIHDTYRCLAHKKYFKRSFLAYTYLFKINKFIKPKTESSLSYLSRMAIGGLSILIFGKGSKLLKY